MTEVQTATVSDARQLSPHVRELTLITDGPPLEFRAGQWISLRLPVGDRPPLNRAYTLALPPASDGRFVLCFDRVENGIGSGYLWDLPVDSSLEFTGPLGNFTRPMEERRLVWVASFTGIVPFRAMLHEIRHQGISSPIRLLYDSPSETERIYHDEFLAFAEEIPDFTYFPVSGMNEITQHLQSEPDASFVPMVCGIRDFTATIRHFLIEHFGFDRKAVKLENYSGPSR